MITPQPAHRDASLGGIDLLLLTLLCSILFVLCIVTSPRHLFWSDELFGYAIIHNPTLRQTMRGWWNGADGGPPLYYFFGRVWGLIFGFSEISQRLFSTFGMAASAVMVWIMTRRFFPLAAVAPAVAVVYLLPDVMVWQAENGRFYGLYLATAVFAGLVFLRVAGRRSFTAADLLLSFLAPALLIGSHTLGIIFSATLLGALVALDLLRSNLRWPLYAANLAGWIAFPLSLHAIRQAASVAKFGFWTVRPSLVALAKGTILYNRYLAETLAVAALLALIVLLTSRQTLASGRPGRPSFVLRLRDSDRLPIVFLLLALVAAELVLFAKSHFGTSIFSDRYLLPLVILNVFLLSFCFATVLRIRPLRWLSSPSLALLPVLLVIALCLRHAWHMRSYEALYPAAGFDQRLQAKLPPGSTIVTTFLPFVTFLHAYDRTHNVIYLEDWTYDLDPRNGHPNLSGHRMMDYYGLSGYGEIARCNDIIAAHQDFTLITEDGRAAWVEKRLAHEPDIQLTRVAENQEWYPATVWTVHRVGSPQQDVCR